MNNSGLERLGYDTWVQQNSAESLADGCVIARVIEVNKGSYVVSDGEHELPAELPGRFVFDTNDATDFPTVGDWVAIRTLDDFTRAIIHCVLPRKTVLKRKEPGRRIAFQLIASNIDFGLVVQSAQRPNLNLLDRYVAMLNESGIQPVAVFSKIDLLSDEQRVEVDNTLAALTIPFLLISNTADKGVEQLSNGLVAGKTYCLLGQSGVGKTSLLNRLLGTSEFRVNEVREKDGRGRHTTARRQLVCLDSGSIFVDTPGMRELGNFGIAHGLDQTFAEYAAYAQNCRFRDCTHTHESGCAVIEAVKNGDIDESRYRNLLKLRKESEFYEMSYQERRTKDKSFGKMIKNYKKRGEKN